MSAYHLTAETNGLTAGLFALGGSAGASTAPKKGSALMVEAGGGPPASFSGLAAGGALISAPGSGLPDIDTRVERS